MRRLELAKEILDSATALLLEGYSDSPGIDPNRLQKLGVEKKSSFKDLVTIYDRKVETFIRGEIKKAFPNDFILGEEESPSNREQMRDLVKDLSAFWTLDPIDGTTNYSRSYPFFCSTLAYVEKHQHVFSPQIGVTYNPVSKEMFWAERGQGAWLNRKALHVTNICKLEESLLITGFANERSGHGDKSFQIFKDLTRRSLGVRRDGAAALDLAYVASGRVDAYWEFNLSPWDIAAGVILVEEAGGKVSRPDGSAIDLFAGDILASTPELQPIILAEINSM